MASHRPAVPASMKRALVDQVGGKCANPGCSNRLIELHHIREWHVYQTHDADHMIAVCPACHDAITRGRLRITDPELYRWKQIDRAGAHPTGHIFVEPGNAPKLQLGSVTVQGDSGLVVFDLTGRHSLSFAVRDGDIMLINLKIAALDGTPQLDIVDGYIRRRNPALQFDSRPGAVDIPAGLYSPLMPSWVRDKLLAKDPMYGATRRVPLLSLTVLDRGLVQVEGFWADDQHAVVITRRELSFVTRSMPKPTTLVGGGRDTILHYVGPVDTALFQFADRPDRTE